MPYHHYLPVPQRDDPSPEPDEKLQDLKQPIDSTRDRIARFAVVLILLCTVIDFICGAYLVSVRHVDAPNRVVEHHKLPYRSTYTQLEGIYAGKSNTRRRPDVVNLPRVMVPVDKASPRQVFPLWPERKPTEGGMVPIRERRVRVTPHISSIAEFHIVDYEMERCTVKIRFGHISGHAYHDTSIEVWDLSLEGPLDTDALSWDSKPNRRELIGSIPVVANATKELPAFECKGGSYKTLELACGSGACDVDIIATMKQPLGLYINQEQTL